MDAGNLERSPARLGRQPSTSHAELSHISLQLFIERGFENTTVDEIAAAAGIGRRTLFRYFPSKNDLPWGDFASGLEQMRGYLRALPPETPMIEALSAAVVDFNRFPKEELPFHRERMNLLLNVPALVAHSTLRYAEWRQVVAEYAALKLGVPEDSLQPRVIGWTFLAVSLSAYEQWLQDDRADLAAVLRSSFETLRAVFTGGDGHGDWTEG
jgi:mycofactocin system transcriptional regulator